MKKTILISAHGSNHWIGGVYYRKNILFSLLQNEYISKNFNIIVATTESLRTTYEGLPGDYRIYIENENKSIGDKIRKVIFLCRNNVKYVFPSDNYKKKWRWKPKDIYWIADFQHHCYPEYFKKDDINNRIFKEKKIDISDAPLVLSSEDSKKFYVEHYRKRNVYVVPFVSYIEPAIRKLSVDFECDVIEKFGLRQSKYACIMNQFWKHKNHSIVFEAVEKIFEENPSIDFNFVFTGKLEDYRNPEYIEQIRTIMDKSIVKKHIKMLGFIERDEQIAVMKNAAFVIQPSLFEGWGTVVEDAKVLDKTILLSDIPVHREQRSDKSIMFNPYDSSGLASLIRIEIEKEHVDDVALGISDMYQRAKQYSLRFEDLLRDLEGF